jgi:hypothetical protein
VREQAHADRCGGVELDAVEVEGPAERLVDPCRHGLRDDDRRLRPGESAGAPLEIREQQEELVAALPCHQIGLARAAAQAIRELGE